MKDESGGNVIKEFIGLRLKMYSILDTKNIEKSNVKDIIHTLSMEKFVIQYFIEKFLDIK